MNKSSIVTLAFAVLLCSCNQQQDPNPVLTVECGQIQGAETEEPGILVYESFKRRHA